MPTSSKPSTAKGEENMNAEWHTYQDATFDVNSSQLEFIDRAPVLKVALQSARREDARLPENTVTLYLDYEQAQKIAEEILGWTEYRGRQREKA
jgi:hypothetical protein